MLHTVCSMQPTSDSGRLQRANVSDAVVDSVRHMIVDGRLADGERINEVHLAETLGVSRTPIREALSRLAFEGALTSTPSFGYSVRPLSVDEFEQLYELRPVFDPEALRLAGIPSAERIRQLERINRALANEREGAAAIERDDEFHLELLSGCPNRVLIGFIQNLIVRTRRYEIALMRETHNVTRATEEHEYILDALRDGNLRSACAALKRNMQSGREPILEWLRRRESTKAHKS